MLIRSVPTSKGAFRTSVLFTMDVFSSGVSPLEIIPTVARVFKLSSIVFLNRHVGRNNLFLVILDANS